MLTNPALSKFWKCSVPLCTVTVPLLLNTVSIPVGPLAAVLVNVPELLNTPLTPLKKKILPSLHVELPALFSAQPFSMKWSLPEMASVPPDVTVKEPAPLKPPPVQVTLGVLKLAVPDSVPLKVMLVTVNGPGLLG